MSVQRHGPKRPCKGMRRGDLFIKVMQSSRINWGTPYVDKIEAFLGVSKSKSKNIVLKDNNLLNAKKAVQLDNDVDSKEVITAGNLTKK